MFTVSLRSSYSHIVQQKYIYPSTLKFQNYVATGEEPKKLLETDAPGEDKNGFVFVVLEPISFP